MKTRTEVLEVLRSLKAELRERYHVESIALFGSYAREEQGEGSDIDVLSSSVPVRISSILSGFHSTSKKNSGPAWTSCRRRHSARRSAGRLPGTSLLHEIEQERGR